MLLGLDLRHVIRLTQGLRVLETVAERKIDKVCCEAYRSVQGDSLQDPTSSSNY